jgi:hypothetical protein
MIPRIKELRRLEKITTRRDLCVSSEVDCTGCKQALALPGGTYYCGILKEETTSALCRCCPYYDMETLEYRLFRRE